MLLIQILVQHTIFSSFPKEMSRERVLGGLGGFLALAKTPQKKIITKLQSRSMDLRAY